MANDQVFLVSRRRTLSLSHSRSLSPASASVTVAIENLREKVLEIKNKNCIIIAK
jgi:DNA-binding response OmpR family regulator